MSGPSYRYSRSRRRDRTAAIVAKLALCIMGLLSVGGVWWLLGVEAGVSKTDTVRPLFVLQPPAKSPVRSIEREAAEIMPTPPLDPAKLPDAEPSEPTESTSIQVVESEPVSAEQARAITEQQPAEPMFNGRPIRPVRTVRMLVTAYSPDERSCGKFADNITASGYSVWTNGMKLVAADKKMFAFGDILTVPGYNEGHPVPVLDRGGKIKGHRLDVLYPTHNIARQWGAQWLDVVVWEYAD